jgi:hypothetical protein
MRELTRRYVVMTMAASAPFDCADRDAPFVLKPWKDPAALAALKTYRDHCYAELARELDEWIAAIEGGPVARGGVGRRNELHLASVGPTAGRRARRPATKTRPRGQRTRQTPSGRRPGRSSPRSPRGR